jgi:transcription initiation factor TFIIIB Brf1 subunit/transcription initiation factor TFIIB
MRTATSHRANNLFNADDSNIEECIQSEQIQDDWDSFLEEITTTNNSIDHNKIIDEINNIPDLLDLSLNLEKKIDSVLQLVDYRLCPECQIVGKINDTLIICEKCGLEREWDSHTTEGYSISVDQSYNTNNSFMTFNVVGVNAYCYNQNLLKTCSDYSSYRNHNNKKEIVNRIYQYEGNKPPTNIINQTADLFDQIKTKGYVYRGNGKLGVIGACLFYACMMHNLTRTPREIALIMGIDERFLSQGDRVLQELNELGIINIPTNYKPLHDYLNQFFSVLNIPMQYKQFVIDIIIRAEKKHLHIKNESRTTTKCVGVIYLLTRRIKSLKHIKKETISAECNNISKSTFIKYYNLIMAHPKLMKKVFKRHSISMPLIWKEI